jgi:hypothetical protein
MATPRKTAPAGDRFDEHSAMQAQEHRTIREPEREAPRKRSRRSFMEQRSEFDIPVKEIPEGSSYEWKRFSVNGQEDPFYLASMRSQGWEPVDPKRHPDWVPPGYDRPTIIKGGMILMERPIELTQEARTEARQLARQQVRVAEQRLGLTARGEMDRTKPTLVKEVGRMVPSVEE